MPARESSEPWEKTTVFPGIGGGASLLLPLPPPHAESKKLHVTPIISRALIRVL